MPYTPLKITIEVPEDIVEDVVTTQRKVIAGTEPDEWAAYAIIGEWIGQGDSLDIEHEITQAILMQYEVPIYRD